MISDQCTYTCLHHNTPFYAFISHILTFVSFPDFFYDWRVASLYSRNRRHEQDLFAHILVDVPQIGCWNGGASLREGKKERKIGLVKGIS